MVELNTGFDPPFSIRRPRLCGWEDDHQTTLTVQGIPFSRCTNTSAFETGDGKRLAHEWCVEDIKIQGFAPYVGLCCCFQSDFPSESKAGRCLDVGKFAYLKSMVKYCVLEMIEGDEVGTRSGCGRRSRDIGEARVRKRSSGNLDLVSL